MVSGLGRLEPLCGRNPGECDGGDGSNRQRHGRGPDDPQAGPECGLNYCRTDWETFPVFDEGFYDCTIGICPSGHRHTVDD